MSNPQSTTIESLEKARDAAREAAANHPNQAKVEALRTLIVEAKRATKERLPAVLASVARKAHDLLGAEITSDKVLETLVAQREKLQAEQHAPVQKAQEALTFARRGARAAADGKKAEAFNAFTIEQLEARRDELTRERKALKREQRAVAVALSAKQQEAETAALLARLSPEERASLKKSLN